MPVSLKIQLAPPFEDAIVFEGACGAADSEIWKFKFECNQEQLTKAHAAFVDTSNKNADLNKIYKKVRKRAKWVRTQQIFFEQFHPRTPPRQYVSGENHRYLGRQLRLRIKQGVVCEVKVSAGHILVSSHYPSSLKLTRELVTDWFKVRVHQKFREQLEICQQKFPVPEKSRPHGIIIRQMHNRWGSMTGTKRLVLNTRLIHAPCGCIDYVIIHELCHIQHPNHSPKFWKLLTSILPNWQKRKNQLEKYFI